MFVVVYLLFCGLYRELYHFSLIGCIDMEFVLFMSETDTKVHFSHILVIFFRVSGRSATFHTSYTHIHINILTIHPITTRTVLLYFSLYYRNCTKTYLRILGRIDQSKCCTAHQTNHLTPLLWLPIRRPEGSTGLLNILHKLFPNKRIRTNQNTRANP